MYLISIIQDYVKRIEELLTSNEKGEYSNHVLRCGASSRKYEGRFGSSNGERAPCGRKGSRSNSSMAFCEPEKESLRT
jgi:hypothetical protein